MQVREFYWLYQYKSTNMAAEDVCMCMCAYAGQCMRMCAYAGGRALEDTSYADVC